MALHIIQTALTTEALSEILACIAPTQVEQVADSSSEDTQHDVIMLINGASVLANRGSASSELLREYRVYCLSNHADLLGVTLDSAVTPCDMATFVSLSAAHRQNISW